MAFIRGSWQGNSQIVGTAQDDVIVAFGSHNTIIDTGGRNSVVSGYGGYDRIVLGSLGDEAFGGSENVLLTGYGNTLGGGDEDYRVASLQGGNTVTLGDGNNNLWLNGQNNSVRVGTGNNDLVFTGGGTQVEQYAGLTSGGNETNIAFSGTGNSFRVSSVYSTAVPTAVTTITGGEGDSTFNFFSSGSFTLRTDGLNNRVSVGPGRFDLQPGDGYASISLIGTPRLGGPSGTIQLEGTHNTITGSGQSVTVEGGDGYTTISLTNSSPSTLNATLGGTHNTVSGNISGGTIDTGAGDATVSLSFSSATVVFRGSGNVANLVNAAGGTIDDQSDGLLVNIQTGNYGFSFFDETIQNFGADRGAVVALDDVVSGFSTVEEAYEALVSDGAGNTVLDAAGMNQIVFANLDPTDLHEYNFRII